MAKSEWANKGSRKFVRQDGWKVWQDSHAWRWHISDKDGMPPLDPGGKFAAYDTASYAMAVADREIPMGRKHNATPEGGGDE